MASEAEVDLIINATGALADAQRELDRVVRQAQATMDPVTLQTAVRQTQEVVRLRAQLNAIVARVQAATPPIRVDVDTDDDSVRRLGDSFARLGQRAASLIGPIAGLAGSIGGIGLAAGAAVPLVAGIVAAVSELGPAAAVGVSALLTLKLAAGTLQVAMIGVKEAIDVAFDPEATPEELAKAMATLAPEARSFVTELRSMRGELDEIRRSVQNRFFQGFDDALQRLSTTVLPTVSGAMERTADSLNKMALGAADAAVELDERGIFGRALDSATASLEELEDVPGRVTTALGLLAAAAGPSLERFAKKADEISVRVTDSLISSFESGELEGSIEGAVDIFDQMGRIVKNIFSGLANIIGGVTTEAGSLFFILEQLSEAFERLTASEEFQSILSEIVQTADELVKNILPLLKEAFVQLAPVIEEIGPPLRDFIREIGPELQPIIEKLGPILKDLAIIFKEQLPFAIEFTKGALQVLGLALDAVHWILENLIIPIVRAVARVLNSDLVKAIASTSREVAGKIGEMVQKFDNFRATVARVVGQAAGTLLEFVQSVGRFAGRIASSMGEVIQTFKEIPGAIRAAVGDLGNLLVRAGQDAVRGLITGLLSQIGRLRSIAAEIGSIVAEAVTGILKISSPSRVFIDIGKDTVAGFVVGLERSIPRLELAAKNVGLVVPDQVRRDTRRVDLSLPRARDVMPTVLVQIGNERLDSRIDYRARKIQDNRERTLSQGVRR